MLHHNSAPHTHLRTERRTDLAFWEMSSFGFATSNEPQISHLFIHLGGYFRQKG